jgi:TPR repeat protein
MRGLMALRHVGLVAGALAMVGCAVPQQSTGPNIEQARAQFRDGNFEAAAPNLWILAKSGNPRAQVMLGMMYDGGHGVTQDAGEAVRLYEMAVAQDFPAAFGLLGRIYATGAAGTHDLARAIDLYERGIALGDEWSAFFRGLQYDTGEGAEHNVAEAVRLYRMAAEKGNPRALTRLGTLHMNGDGVERDLAEARRLLERAAPDFALARRMLARLQEMEGAVA